MFKMFKKNVTDNVDEEMKQLGISMIKVIRDRYGCNLSEPQAVATIMAAISVAIATTKGTNANPACAAEFFMNQLVRAFPDDCQVRHMKHSERDSAQTDFGFVPGKTAH